MNEKNHNGSVVTKDGNIIPIASMMSTDVIGREFGAIEVNITNHSLRSDPHYSFVNLEIISLDFPSHVNEVTFDNCTFLMDSITLPTEAKLIKFNDIPDVHIDNLDYFVDNDEVDIEFGYEDFVFEINLDFDFDDSLRTLSMLSGFNR